MKTQMRLADPCGTAPRAEDVRTAAVEWSRNPDGPQSLAEHAFAQGVLAERAAAEGPTQPLPAMRESYTPPGGRDFLVTSLCCGEEIRIEVCDCSIECAEGVAFALNALGHTDIEVFETHQCHVEIGEDGTVIVEAP